MKNVSKLLVLVMGISMAIVFESDNAIAQVQKVKIVKNAKFGYVFAEEPVPAGGSYAELVNLNGYTQVGLTFGHDGTGCNSSYELYWYDADDNWLCFEASGNMNPAAMTFVNIKAPKLMIKVTNNCGNLRNFRATYYATK